MADAGRDENVDSLNTSSFLDSSVAARKYEVCTGPVTDGEKAYLLRHGLALEDSRGELYGEPDTIIDFDDSIERMDIAATNTPTSSPASKSFKKDLNTSGISTRSITKKRNASISGSVDSDSDPVLNIEYQLTKLKLNDKTAVADEIASPAATPSAPLQTSLMNSPHCGTTPSRCNRKSTKEPANYQHNRLTRLSVKRDPGRQSFVADCKCNSHMSSDTNTATDKMDITGTGVSPPVLEQDIAEQDHHDLANKKQNENEEKENNPPTQEQMEEIAQIDQDPGNKSRSQFEEERSLLMFEKIEDIVHQGEEVSIGSLPPPPPPVSEQMGEVAHEHGSKSQNQDEDGQPNKMDDSGMQASPERTDEKNTSMKSGASEASNKSVNNASNELFNSSSSSGEEFNDTITRMEKILAMADLAEEEEEHVVQAQNQNVESPQAHKEAADKQAEFAPTVTKTGGSVERVKKQSMPPRTSIGSGYGVRTPGSAKIKATAASQKPSPSPLLRQTPGAIHGNRAPTPASLGRPVAGNRNGTPVPTRKTPVTAIRSETPRSRGGCIRTTYFPSSSPRAGPPGFVPHSPKNTLQENTGSKFKSPLPPLPSPLVRAKREGFFTSPGTNLGNPKGNTASTPIRPLKESESMQAAICSPVSTIYPSPTPVAKAQIPTKSIPISLGLAKLKLPSVPGEKNIPSPSALLKKNYKKGANAINSPVAAYIYSTPTPTKIQRVVKTTDNSNEKKIPIKATGGVTSLPRRSGIPRFAAFSKAGSLSLAKFNPKILKEFSHNQNPPQNGPATNGEMNEIKSPAQVQRVGVIAMKPVAYHGSDKIRENAASPNLMAPPPKGIDVKIQRHKGIVDENTNATIVEDESVNKAYIPVRVKECKKT